MITAVMAKFHLDGFGTRGQRQQLVTKADTKYRGISFQNSFNRFDGVSAWLRVARAVGEEDPVGVQGQRVRGRGGGRHPVAQDLRAAARHAPGAVEHVLVSERHAARRLFLEREKGVKAGLPLLDARAAGF